MTCNAHFARRAKKALRELGLDGATVAWRANVSRRLVARVLVGDTSVELGQFSDVVFHLGLDIELVRVPENPRVAGPVPTVVDVAVQRLRGI